jgi:NAD(P)-dependent dehydrogenase (short-subunit alcohol dehydrogenase family)
MDLQLEGRRAIVTGGSRGIGLVIARALAEEGVRVVLAARTAEPLEKAAAALSEATGADVRAVVADTGDDTAVRGRVARAVEELGGVDILVNNAAVPGGRGGRPALVDVRDEDVLDDFNVKVVGYLRTARAVAPHLVAQGWGRIINIGGLAARQTGTVSASLRNIGVAALTKNLADELGGHGITVNAVHPGLTITERIDDVAAGLGLDREHFLATAAANTSSGRVATAEDVAAVVTFLASPRSLAVNGDAIAAGGGVRGPIHY